MFEGFKGITDDALSLIQLWGEFNFVKYLTPEFGSFLPFSKKIFSLRLSKMRIKPQNRRSQIPRVALIPKKTMRTRSTSSKAVKEE
ncbi:hypothetical protein ACYULU_02900 [Breznakiellaceae bacterium SP9]